MIQRVDITKTRIIFFDLEFYVPEQNRKLKGFSYNPWHDNSKLLGGSFFIASAVKNQFSKTDEELFSLVKSKWLWDYVSEYQLVGEFYDLFASQINKMEEFDQGLSLLVCGIGIQNSDIPVLINLFLKHNYLSPEEAFTFSNKIRIFDLSVLSIPLFNNKSYLLYPKKKNEILSKFFPGVRFESGTSVWEMYEQKNLEDIKRRTNDEVFYTVKLYYEIKRNLLFFKDLENKHIKNEQKNKKMLIKGVINAT